MLPRRRLVTKRSGVFGGKKLEGEQRRWVALGLENQWSLNRLGDRALRLPPLSGVM